MENLTGGEMGNPQISYEMEKIWIHLKKTRHNKTKSGLTHQEFRFWHANRVTFP